ncbi:MAG: glycosyltransferase family 4 protein [Candidatus Marinimicrobia bacterium]|nr:glycosyltransferase family 4 protein [Candidatus Neomarinimicrobiota bacterium]
MTNHNKVRVLFLSHFYPPEMGGAAARISGLAKWLVKFGHEVTVITGYPNYPTGKIFPEYINKKNKVEYIDNVKILRARVLPVSYHSILVRLINYFTLFFSALWIGIKKRNNFDIIIASSPPLTIGILGLILSKIYKIPWIFDIRDIWPDIAVEAGMLKGNGIVHKLSKKLADYLYRQATYITPVTERKLTKIEKIDIPISKISVVSNGVDFDLINNVKRKDWRRELGLENKFILSYAGLIGIAQGVNVIIETAIRLKEENDIHFLIVGEGVEKQKLQNRVESLELNNITFLPSQPKELIPSLLTTSDIALIPLVSDKLLDAVPSKLLEAWACKLPIILIAGGEAADIVSEAQGGIVVNSNDFEGIMTAIIKFKDSPELMKKYSKNGFNYVSKHYGRESLARAMEKVIFKIIEL